MGHPAPGAESQLTAPLTGSKLNADLL